MRGKRPAVVGYTGMNAVRFARRNFGRIDFPVGCRSRIAKVRVLRERRRDHAGDGMTEQAVLRQEVKHTVEDLLKGVRNAVRLANLDRTSRLVYRGVVPIQPEVFDCQRQVSNYARVRLGTKVEV